jgi:DNA polymerase-3 subunit delta'
MQPRLPWHHSLWENLLRCQKTARLPHALLLKGPEGLGKRYFAEQVSQAFLCQTVDQSSLACGQCRACILYKAGNHPDIIRLEPAEKGTSIKVEQIRALSRFLDHTSHRGGYKIALVNPAEAMNLNAANSLLKTLEEPPPSSFLLLVTANPSQLPATLRSRCQGLTFRTPSLEQALAWLTPQLKGQHDDPRLLLSLSGGAPMKALAYAQNDHIKIRQRVFQNYYHVVSGQADPVDMAELWHKNHDIREICLWLISWHRDMIRLKMVDNPPYLVNRDLQSILYQLAKALPMETLFQYLDDVLRMYTLCATQVQPQLMVEAFLSHCVNASTVDPV